METRAATNGKGAAAAAQQNSGQEKKKVLTRSERRKQVAASSCELAPASGKSKKRKQASSVKFRPKKTKSIPAAPAAAAASPQTDPQLEEIDQKNRKDRPKRKRISSKATAVLSPATKTTKLIPTPREVEMEREYLGGHTSGDDDYENAEHALDDDYEDEEDDEDLEDDDEILGEHDLDPAAGLQGLLARLGGGLGMFQGGFGGGGGGRYRTLLENLRAVGDEPRQEAALREVTEMLLMGNEETLQGLRPDQFVTALQAILNMEHNPQMSLMACRALTNMLEAIPSSSAAVAQCAPALCAKLLCIEYIDLAEQSLSALSKLAQEQGSAVLQAGGLNAVLSYLDFFPMNLQRSAVNTAATICKFVSTDSFDLAKDAIPILSNMLQFQDKTIVEAACACLSRLADNLITDVKCLKALCPEGVVANLVRLMSIQPLTVSELTFTNIIHMLAVFCACCPEVASTLHSEGIYSTLRNILRGFGPESATTSSGRQAASSGTSFELSSEQLNEIVSLATELLPVLPSDLHGASYLRLHCDQPVARSAVWEWLGDHSNWMAFGSRESSALEMAYRNGATTVVLTVHDRQYIINMKEMLQINRRTRHRRRIRRKEKRSKISDALTPENDPRVKSLSQPELLKTCSDSLLGVLFDLHLSTATPAIKHKCTATILRLLHYAEPSVLTEVLEDLSISSYLASMLTHNNPGVVIGALQMTEILMTKLPHIFHTYFRRVGVVYEVTKLAVSKRAGKEKKRRNSDSKKAKSKALDTDESQKIADLKAAEFVKDYSKRLAEKFFPDVVGKPEHDPHPAADTIREVKNLASTLLTTFQEKGNSEELGPVLLSIEETLREKNISSFETLYSGLADALLKLLTFAGNDPSFRRERIQEFCRVFFLPKNSEVEQTGIALLMENLHGALNTLEKFPLKEVKTNSAINLSNPIKLKLESDGPHPALREHQTQVVLIEPLASIQAIEEFLWPKVAKPARKSRSRRSSTRSNDEEASGMDDLEQEGGSRSDKNNNSILELRLAGEESNEAASSEESGVKGLPQSSGTEKHLTMLLNGNPLPSNITIYQAIKAYADPNEPAGEMGSDFASKVLGATFTLKYRPYEASEESDSNAFGNVRSSPPDATAVAAAQRLYDTASDPAERALFLSPSAPLNPSEPTYVILTLIYAIHGLNARLSYFLGTSVLPVLSSSAFVNNHLSSKILRQVSDFDTICSATYPDWCQQIISSCPFIITLETRQKFFSYTAFGSVRALQRYQTDTLGQEEGNQEKHRLSRTKVRISRERLFESAQHIMTSLATAKSLLEVEYFDEAGTGLGPTLEFYALVCRFVKRRSLKWWRDECDADDDIEYVRAPVGLFPKPATETDDVGELKKSFDFLGRFVAKALVDGRLLDLPFSLAFYKWMKGEQKEFCLADLEYVDPSLHQTLAKLQKLCAQKKELEASLKDTKELCAAIESISLDGVLVKDIGLDFTLPGYGLPLKNNGEELVVTIHNLQEYIELVVAFTMNNAVSTQMNAFCAGFGAVFSLDTMHIFAVEEMGLLLNGTRYEPWIEKDLVQACKPDHGFTQDSEPIKWLYEVMASYGAEEQRQFVSFITGSPNLPVGGLKALRPQLTIVRKSGEPGNVDHTLPSVMTCQNYLKLPPYSKKEILESKIKKAITEGIGSFHLS